METLRRGSKGPVVQLLQKALLRSGYYKGKTDGDFGPATETAVKAFQRPNGLTADGVVGNGTWNALKPYLTRTTRYTVKSGDTLSSIAASHGVTVPEIMAANPQITDENQIDQGLNITIPWPGAAIANDLTYSSSVMSSDIDALKARYSFLETGSIGKSVLGTDIPYIRFGRGSKPVVYNGSHHANEWITTPILMTFLDDLSNALVHNKNIGNQSASSLFNTVSLYVVPMVNPDGVNLVTGEIQPGSPAYKSAYAIRGTLPFPSSWKANIRGTDPNNNYPALFEEGVREKNRLGINHPGPRDYTGPYPLSAPESKAMYDFTKKIEPRLTIAMHTQGREIYWRFNNITPPNGLRIGELMAAASGYHLADPPGRSYGGYKDWFIQDYNLPGYTVEMGAGVNPLPISRFTAFYNEVEPILLIGMKEAS